MRTATSIIVLIFVLTACSRSLIVTKDDPYYDLRIKRMNSVGGDHKCKVGFKDGYNFETEYFNIANDSMKLVRKGEFDTLAVLFDNVTSIYYIDHWDGLIQGGILGGIIGFPVGYILLPDWTDVGGTTHHVPEAGGCCLGTAGVLAGSIAGAIRGRPKMYNMHSDSTLVKDSLLMLKDK